MPSFRFADNTLADGNLIVNFMSKRVANQNLIEEAAVDFGSCRNYASLAVLQELHAEGAKALLGFDDNVVLRSIIITINNAGMWEVLFIGVDKALNANQRLAAMRLALNWLRLNVPAVTPQTRVFGTVKSGGRIDVFMNGKLPIRIVRGGFVYYEGSMADLGTAVA